VSLSSHLLPVSVASPLSFTSISVSSLQLFLCFLPWLQLLLLAGPDRLSPPCLWLPVTRSLPCGPSSPFPCCLQFLIQGAPLPACSSPFLQLPATIVSESLYSLFSSPEPSFSLQCLSHSTVVCQQGQHQSVAKQFPSLRSSATPHASLEKPKAAFAGLLWFYLQPEDH